MIHLNTLVGGRNIAILKPMLEHYRGLGVESFIINVHLADYNDPILDEVRLITNAFGTPITSVLVGPWLEVLRKVYRESRERHPSDWHILADQDEFQIYPMELAELELFCNKKGYDYVRGCWVDRLAADGGFHKVHSMLSVWDQFPFGAFLSYPVGAADPRKVVFARSNVDVCVGQHLAYNGRCCPITDVLVQVHHFKWVGGIVAELQARAELLKQAGYDFHIESLRFVKYFNNNGGVVNLKDPNILAAICRYDYQHWPLIQKWLIMLNNYVNIGRQFTPGPASLLNHRNDIECSANTLLSTIHSAGHKSIWQIAIEQLVANLSSRIRSDREPTDQHHNQGEPFFGLEAIRPIWLNSRQ